MSAERRLMFRLIVGSSLLAVAALILQGCPPLAGNGVEVVNDSSFTVVAVYVAQCSDAEWGPNQIDASLLPGDSIVIGGLADGCYDVRAEDDQGGFWEDFDIELANDDTYTFLLQDKAMVRVGAR